MYDDALRLLAGYHPYSNHPQEAIRKLAIEAYALTYQKQMVVADQRLVQAENICKSADFSACGEVLRVRGILVGRQGQLEVARQFFLESLLFARAHQDRFSEATASLGLGWVALQADHFDEAVDWSKTARKTAEVIGAEDIAQIA